MGTYQSKYTGAEIDALLDTVNDGGSVSKGEVIRLFTGEANAEGTNYNLSDSIENYDLILITGARMIDGDAYNQQSLIIPPSQIKERGYGTTNVYQLNTMESVDWY